jgi:hypothetical protein
VVTEHDKDQEKGPKEATPVPPPPFESAPSSTGLVEGDESELEQAPPSANQGER